MPVTKAGACIALKQLLAHEQEITALVENLKHEPLGNFAEGMSRMEAWRAPGFQRYQSIGLVSARCESLDLGGWLGSSLLSLHSDLSCLRLGERGEVYSPSLWLFQRPISMKNCFLIPSLNSFFINLHLFVLVPIFFLSLNISSLSLVFTPLMYL